MKSFASVQLMLALEEAFDIEFPDGMMKRNTFRSPAAIEKAVQSLMNASDPWCAAVDGDLRRERSARVIVTRRAPSRRAGFQAAF